MEFFKTLDETTRRALKFAALVVGALIVLAVINNTLGVLPRMGDGTMGVSYDMGVSTPSLWEEKAYESGAQLSARNVVSSDLYMPPSPGGYVPGDDSEAFEVKEYNATIETRNLDADCSTIRSLKSREDVIFENASEYDRGCSYTFKVKKGSVEEVLTLIKNLDPRELSENAYTIKREVTDYTSEVTILESKLASLDSTLTEAIASYENITALATRMGDVESLAKIIESKLTIIERLTSARIETVNALERVNRAKADALDRLEYTYISVTVYENTFTDGESIKDSWKAAVQKFVAETNILVQDVSVGLVTLLLLILKFALYLLVILVAVKFGWKFAQKIWTS